MSRSFRAGCRRCSTISLAAVVAGALAAPPAGATERLGDAVKPLEQRIALELDPREPGYRGETVLELEVARETSSIRLHSREPEIRHAELRDANGQRRPLVATRGDEAIVALDDGQPIAPGRYRLTLGFEAPYNTNAVALYRTEIAGAPYLFTQMEAIDARGAFPCFDEPAFKIPFELELTIPAGFDAVANTGVASESPRADGGRTLRFQRTRPLPTYLVAMAVGTFDFVPVPGTSIPTRIVAPKGMGHLSKHAVAMTPPLLAELERWFGFTYPYDKLDFVAIPEYWFGAMENPGAITFLAEILLPGDNASVADRRTLAQVIAHELAHIWFGDYVTMAWWDDLWLNESFAEWMGDKAVEARFPELGLAASELGSLQRQMTIDARASATPIRIENATPADAFQTVGVAYEKGKAVLSMVEGWIGAEAFRAGVLDHLARHAWGNATAADLWSALGRASSLPVEAVLRSFVEQPGLPTLEVVSIEGNRVRLAQRRYATAGVELPALSWRIPIRIRAGDGARSVEKRLLLETPTAEVTLDGLERIDWLTPNAGPSGYYRWKLPAAAFERLVAVAPDRLVPFERRQLLGNAEALLASGDLDAGGYLALLAGTARDPEPAVVGGALSALQSIRTALGDDGRAPGWGDFVRSALTPALERIGRLPRPGESQEVAALRPRLLSRLGVDAQDAAALAWAKSEAEALLARHSKVDEALATVALELAAATGDRSLYARYLERALAPEALPNERSRYLDALASFRDRALAEETLALFPSGRIRGDEIFLVYGLEEIDAAMPDRLLDWTIGNYDRIAAELPAEFRAFLVGTGGGCELARYERAVAFFGAPERQAPGTPRQIAQVGDSVRACVELRRREGANASRFLASGASATADGSGAVN